MMTLHDRLARGTVVLMDGGTGTEIQRRGHDMDAAAWSGLAHMAAPDGVRGVHEDYIRAGAEIIIANTFATSRPVLAAAGLGDEFVTVNRRAVEIAIEARAGAAEAPVWVAGSISSMSPLSDAAQTAHGAEVEADYRRQAEVLAEAGADLIVAEMMLDIAGSAPVVQAASSVGLPLWVGFSASLTPAGRLVGYLRPADDAAEADDFGTLVDTILAIGGDVAGVMHSAVAATGPALDVLSERWSGPKMAYAETGHFVPPNWHFEEAVGPDEHADLAAAWVADRGVQIVGGCCGTGPEHIRALRDRLA
jgi:S-methylmethionine-dependent homocysteine/selenocysteine methylase